VIEQVGLEQLHHISTLFEQYGRFFPDNTYRSLVHADYDPSNILIGKIEGRWKITAILDWEFAFSGSWLCDVSNMLRYAHQMRPKFKESFWQGVTDSGMILPSDWQITVDLLNLFSLLDCLAYADPRARPRQCLDVKELIGYFTNRLNVI
jgi:thiamine kinase-like enzyme